MSQITGQGSHKVGLEATRECHKTPKKCHKLPSNYSYQVLTNPNKWEQPSRTRDDVFLWMSAKQRNGNQDFGCSRQTRA